MMQKREEIIGLWIVESFSTHVKVEHVLANRKSFLKLGSWGIKLGFLHELQQHG